jgi:hypothetical protein
MSMTALDTIVIGSGLTGLLLTHRLHQAGKNVALFEARETLGGRYRRQTLYSSPGLDFFPALNENIELLEWLKAIAPLAIQFEVQDHRPQLYDEGRWRPFAGFGEAGFQSVTELAHFSHTHEIFIEPGFEQLVRVLIEQLPVVGEIRHEVTGIKVNDGKVTEVIINGEKSVKAEQVIFTAHAGFLNHLIEGEGLHAKNRTRLAKMQPWTAVTLELNHTPPLADDPAIRIFTHSAKEFEPVVGRVLGDRSKWMTLVPSEREAEHEFISQCIRHIKRQLKRAWPLAMEGKVEEKILVQSNAYGQQSLKTKDQFKLPEISNLWLANHILANRPGEIAALEAARGVELGVLDGAPIAPVRQETGADF